MFTLRTVSALSLLSILASVSAASLSKHSKRASGVLPTGPGPNDKFKIGGQCVITFDPDTSGSSKWKNTTIDFMTGANQAMVFLTNVATNIDGTSASSSPVTWTCPEVDPPSAIYFYQFTHGNEEDPTWTTRFLITDADGNSVAPPQSKQPGSDGAEIPWGEGKIVGGSSAGSASAGSSSSATSTATAPSSTDDSASSTTESSATSTTSTSIDSSSSSSSSDSSASRSAQTSNSSSNQTSDAVRNVITLSASALVAVAFGMTLI